jgi:hypothetical protein
MRTLKNIVLNVVDYPLFNILSEFEDMRTTNIIETVAIRVVAKKDARYPVSAGWGRLDEVFTASGWDSLKRVSLAIEIAPYLRSNELEVALRKVAETQFRRLSSSNSVSFDFEVKPLLGLRKSFLLY